MEKVKYIAENSCYYTIGKIYDSFGNLDIFYEVTNDNGMRLCMRKELFENISEIRDEKLKQLGI